MNDTRLILMNKKFRYKYFTKETHHMTYMNNNM